MDTFYKLHGTTVDKFKIGLKNQRIVLTGQTTTGSTATLLDRDSQNYTAESSVFFTAYIIGQGTDSAAYEIKGCYISGVSGVSGYVVNTFVDTNSFTSPAITFSSNGNLTVTVTGLASDTINWTATIDFVTV
jgi:hypothetical protein